MGFALRLSNTKAKPAINRTINKNLMKDTLNMRVNNKDEVLAIMEFIKSANLKGNVEITGDDEFLWDLGGVFLRFLIDNGETTVFLRIKFLS